MTRPWCHICRLAIFLALKTLSEKAFEDIVINGRIADNQYFLLTHNVFYPFREINLLVMI